MPPNCMSNTLRSASAVTARSRYTELLVIALLLAATGAGQRVDAAGNTDRPTLTTTPASVEHPGSGGPAEVLLILDNPTDQELGDITLSVFPAAYHDVLITPAGLLERLDPGGQFAWSVKLPDQLPYPIPDALRIRLDARFGAEEDAPRLVLTTQVEVTRRQLESPEDIAEVKLLASPETLRDRQKTVLTLSVTNKWHDSITVAAIDMPSESYLEIAGEPQANLDIPAYSTALIPLEVQVKDVILPGKYTYGLTVDITWGPAQSPSHGRLAIEREFTLSVLGESELLTALGLPSLLVLPGYLIIVAYLAIRLRAGEQDTLPLWKQMTRPKTILLALTLSLAVNYGYQLRTGRQFLLGYGWSDIWTLWWFSIVAGAAAACVVRLIQFARQTSETRLREDRTYREDDSPIDVLAALQANDAGWVLNYGTCQAGGQTGHVYQLPEQSAAGTKCWIAPLIAVDQGLSDESTEPEHRDRRNQLMEYLNRPGECSPAELSGLLEEGKRAKTWIVRWEASGSIRRPTEIERTAFVQERKQALVAIA